MASETAPRATADEGALALMHASVLSSISLFDQKCTLLLGLDGAAVVFCVNQIRGFTWDPSKPIALACAADYGWAITAVFFLISAILVFAVIWPRAGKPLRDPLFWASWPKAKVRSAFAMPLEMVPPSEWPTAKSFHVGLLGNICRRKKRWFWFVMLFTFLGYSSLVTLETVRFFPSLQTYITKPVRI